MRRISRFSQKTFLFSMALISITGCSLFGMKQAPTIPSFTQSSSENAITTDEYLVRKNDFGDGYIAHIPIKEVNASSQEQIVEILVIQWLEHYKTQSKEKRAIIEDYKFDGVKLLGRTKNDPEIIAGVSFSIIPAQIPNDWASFPGDEIRLNDSWWHLVAPFGVYRDDGEYFWLKLMFGHGT